MVYLSTDHCYTNNWCLFTILFSLIFIQQSNSRYISIALMDEAAFIKSNWIFGYGSIIWKTRFPYIDKSFGFVEGYGRRFWQGSHDHRGTPNKPGRVVTLIKSPNEKVYGVAYRISKSAWSSVINNLNSREIDGYSPVMKTFTSLDGNKFDVWMYLADQNNESFLGDAPVEAIAQQIIESQGPSGTNTEYLLKLADSLRNIGSFALDEHTSTLEKLVRQKIYN